MRLLYILLIGIFLLSCSNFERRDAEAIIQEELQNITWDEVDAYPLLINCKSEDFEQEKACFISEIQAKVAANLELYINENDIYELEDFSLQIYVDTNRILAFSFLQNEISRNHPQLSTYLQRALDSLQVKEPALKRGIPVSTSFILPVQINP